jgi:hypothetical protein
MRISRQSLDKLPHWPNVMSTKTASTARQQPGSAIGMQI